MNGNWSMRRVQPRDIERVVAHGCYGEADAPRCALYAAWVKPRIEAGTYVGWFACEGIDVVAGAGAVLLDWGPTRTNLSGTMARIVNVFTEPAWRGRGIAKCLVKAVMAECEQNGICEFNLDATEEARHLCAALGFQSYPAEMRRCVAPGEYANLVLAKDALVGLRELAAGHVLSESELEQALTGDLPELPDADKQHVGPLRDGRSSGSASPMSTAEWAELERFARGGTERR